MYSIDYIRFWIVEAAVDYSCAVFQNDSLNGNRNCEGEVILYDVIDQYELIQDYRCRNEKVNYPILIDKLRNLSNNVTFNDWFRIL